MTEQSQTAEQARDTNEHEISPLVALAAELAHETVVAATTCRFLEELSEQSPQDRDAELRGIWMTIERAALHRGNAEVRTAAMILGEYFRHIDNWTEMTECLLRRLDKVGVPRQVVYDQMNRYLKEMREMLAAEKQATSDE